MNTWGLFSVNYSTFNIKDDKNSKLTKELRDKVYTSMKVNNLVFNIMGYIPGVCVVSGIARMLVGAALLYSAKKRLDQKYGHDLFVGRHYEEAKATAIAQIVRGAFEALVPLGHAVNFMLDMLATPWNCYHSATWDRTHGEAIQAVMGKAPPRKRAYSPPKFDSMYKFMVIV